MLVNPHAESPTPEITRQLAALLADLTSSVTQDDSHPWMELIAAAAHHRVLYLLMQRIDRDTLPDELAMRVKHQIVRGAADALNRQMHVQRVNTLLNEAGIPALWLKGTALACTLYAQPYLRPMSDIDVLVPYDQRRQALALLEANGYRFRKHQINGQLLSLDEFEAYSHHYELFAEGQLPLRVELHYDLFKRRGGRGDVALLDWFWEHSQVIEAAEGTLRIMQPEALFIYLAAHDIIQHDMVDLGSTSYTGELLLRKYDIYLVLKTYSLNWPLVTEQALRIGWLFAVQESLRQAQAYFGLEIPPGAEIALAQEIPSLSLKDDQKRAMIYLRVMGQMNVSMRLRWMWTNVLFLPQEQMRQLYDLPPNQRVWPYHIRRLVTRSMSLFALGLTMLDYKIRRGHRT